MEYSLKISSGHVDKEVSKRWNSSYTVLMWRSTLLDFCIICSNFADDVTRALIDDIFCGKFGQFSTVGMKIGYNGPSNGE